jgi:hypothetical protein
LIILTALCVVVWQFGMIVVEACRYLGYRRRGGAED